MAETTITHAAPFARYSLRARTPQALEQVTGLKLPRKINNARGDVICLGPDEWLALLPDGAKLNMGDGLPVSIADISYRQIGIVIEGPRAVELIAAGCPLDVARIPVGYAT
ncbi:MAG: sarcosine oxidase gamma subunit, partial [Alphaproteobacteria bacterium]|nr:sarcosine oxidase gamma subunit [Alphaproteobacteria bacterium]